MNQWVITSVIIDGILISLALARLASAVEDVAKAIRSHGSNVNARTLPTQLNLEGLYQAHYPEQIASTRAWQFSDQVPTPSIAESLAKLAAGANGKPA